MKEISQMSFDELDALIKKAKELKSTMITSPKATISRADEIRTELELDEEGYDFNVGGAYDYVYVARAIYTFCDTATRNIIFNADTQKTKLARDIPPTLYEQYKSLYDSLVDLWLETHKALRLSGFIPIEGLKTRSTEDKEIIALRKKGKSVVDIADELDLAQNRVAKVVIDYEKEIGLRS